MKGRLSVNLCFELNFVLGAVPYLFAGGGADGRTDGTVGRVNDLGTIFFVAFPHAVQFRPS